MMIDHDDDNGFGDYFSDKKCIVRIFKINNPQFKEYKFNINAIN